MRPAPVPARATDRPPEISREPEGSLPRIALAAIVVAQIALIVTHVAWRDELQALTLAQHSDSLSALFANLQHEGHPALWYLLLRALPAFDAIATLKALHIAVALSTIALVWTRAPFGPWLRAAILLGALILIEWGTFARSYGLGAALFFAFLAFRNRGPAAYVLLALAANTSAHFLFLSGATVVAVALIERRSSPAGVAIWLAGAALAVATALPAADARISTELAPSLIARILVAFETIGGSLAPYALDQIPPRWEALPLPASILAGLVVPILGTLALYRDRRAAILFLLFTVAVLAFSVLVFPAKPRHTGVIFLLLVGLEWMLCERDAARPSLLSRTWIGLLAAFGIGFGAFALFVPFTPARDLMRFAAENELADEQWAAYPAFMGVDISSRLGKPYFDPERQCLAWFQRWDKASNIELSATELNARLAAAARATGGRMIVLTRLRIDTAAASNLRLLADYAPGLMTEPMLLYEVTVPAGAASDPPLTSCP
jgi:hypothetical protein